MMRKPQSVILTRIIIIVLPRYRPLSFSLSLCLFAPLDPSLWHSHIIHIDFLLFHCPFLQILFSFPFLSNPPPPPFSARFLFQNTHTHCTITPFQFHFLLFIHSLFFYLCLSDSVCLSACIFHLCLHACLSLPLSSYTPLISLTKHLYPIEPHF